MANFISFWSSQSSLEHQKHEKSSLWSILKPFTSKKFANGYQMGTILVCPLLQNYQKLWPQFYLLTLSQKVWVRKQLLYGFVLVAALHRSGAPALFAFGAVCHWLAEPVLLLQSLLMLTNTNLIVHYKNNHSYFVYQPERRVMLFHSPQG